MQPNVKTIQGTTKSGKTGVRFEDNIEIGDSVRLQDGRQGKVTSEGLAGMPEVEIGAGESELVNPAELTIL